VIETVRGRVPVVVSADGLGLEPARDRARRAVARGADALMVLPPSFVKPDQRSLIAYYQAIAEMAPVPIIVQDAPQLTGVGMSPALWASLHQAMPNICVVKVEGTPQGTAISEAIRQTEGRLAVFCGWGGLGMLDALERGCAGSMPAANFTRLFAEIQRRYEEGDVDGAAALFACELPFLLWTMQSVDHSVAATKEEFRRRGIFATSFQREPVVRLDETARGQLTRFLDARLERREAEAN
jgi:4-hydroxy-tetrahydrodipicolinate synthase